MSESTTYLSAEEAREYLRFKTMKGLYHWVDANGVPKFRRGDRKLLFLRRDLDEAVGNRRRHGRNSAASSSTEQGTVGAPLQEAR